MPFATSSFLLLLVSQEPLVASLFLVAMPFAPSSVRSTAKELITSGVIFISGIFSKSFKAIGL